MLGEDVKTIFFDKIGNHFVETGCLLVIGSCDVMSCGPQGETR